MNIKNLNDLNNAILFLRPNANFSIWDTKDLKEYMGDNNPVLLFDRLVNWSPSNPNNCPTESDISNIQQNDFDLFVKGRDDQVKLDKYKDDLTMKALFVEYKKSNPNVKLKDYLNYLEGVQV